MGKQIILFVSDMRQVNLAEILIKKGKQVRCLDIRKPESYTEQLEKLKSLLIDAELLIFPIPITKIPEQDRLNDILMKHLQKETKVMGGCFTTEQRDIFEKRGISYLDFMEDENVTQENAVATAEGTIAEIIKNSPYNLDGAKVIVSGYGFCGKEIADKLRNMGARVTVLARRREVRKQAKKDGFYAADFSFGAEEAMGTNVIVNTVPALVITKYMIKELPKDAYIIDIASNPGGTDFVCAKEHGIKAEHVLGIPGKYAPKESACILSRSIDRFIKQE